MFEHRIPIPIDQQLVAEVLFRGGRNYDIGALIDHLLAEMLDRTADADHWSNPPYLRELGYEDQAEFVEQYGRSERGYRWGPIILPNGTQLKMRYGGKDRFARVKHQKVVLEDEEDGVSYTPSELARRIANNTNRNAWRDLWIKRPRDADWTLADDLRRSLRREIPHGGAV